MLPSPTGSPRDNASVQPSALPEVERRSPVSSHLTATLLPPEPSNLVGVAGSTVIAQAKTAGSVVVKVLSLGINYFLQAVNSIGNSLIFKMIGVIEAASLTSAFQSFARNVFSGMLGAAGQMLGSAFGEKNQKKIREITIASYLLTGLLSLASTAAYVVAYFVFPYVVSPTTAKSTCDFLFYTGFAIWPTLALTTLGQVAYVYDYWKSSLLSSAMNRIPAIALSYLLVAYTGLGVTGIAVGNLAMPWLVYAGMELWMRRNSDFKNVFESSKNPAIMPEYGEITKQLKAMFILSLKVGFQRCTEWLNALVITMLLGALADNNLRSMNPSLNAISLWSLFSQGIGTGANMKIAQLVKALEKAKTDGEPLEEQSKILAEIKSILKNSLIAGVVINAVVGGAMYALRDIIAKLFINNPSPQTLQDAGTLLGIVGLGLVVDAPRLIVSTVMTAFNRPVLPNFISLVLMSLGILASYLSTMKKDDSATIISMFAFRTGTIFLSALANLYMSYKCVTGLDAALDQKVAERAAERAAATTINDARVPMPASESAEPGCMKKMICRLFDVPTGARVSEQTGLLATAPLMR